MFAFIGACALSFAAGALIPRKHRKKITSVAVLAVVPLCARYQYKSVLIWAGSLALLHVLGRQLQMTGLTGGISTGKSAVVRVIRDRFPQVGIIDCDLLARVIVEPGKPALKAIVKLFGADILQADGTLDRTKLARIIFSDADLRRKLTRLTSKYIMWEILKSLVSLRLQGYSEIILDAPLLFESKVLAWVCSPIVVVHVSDEGEWVDRLVKRDTITREEALKKIASQMPISQKIKLAGFVIDNSGTLSELEARVDSIFARFSLGDYSPRPKM
mmetsp:Transcript_4083/g.8311  ORF Transcript_4083/g.8311 Transcript_4083/m.8311 type:complete len:273 (-) Transcript_4083:106-924(-)